MCLDLHPNHWALVRRLSSPSLPPFHCLEALLLLFLLVSHVPTRILIIALYSAPQLHAPNSGRTVPCVLASSALKNTMALSHLLRSQRGRVRRTFPPAGISFIWSMNSLETDIADAQDQSVTPGLPLNVLRLNYQCLRRDSCQQPPFQIRNTMLVVSLRFVRLLSGLYQVEVY